MTTDPLPPLAEVLRARYAYWVDTAREMTRQTEERVRLTLARECELLIPELAPYDAELARLRTENAELKRIAGVLYHCALWKEPRDMAEAMQACQAWQRIAEAEAP